jgi:hypothetical protein
MAPNWSCFKAAEASDQIGKTFDNYELTFYHCSVIIMLMPIINKIVQAGLEIQSSILTLPSPVIYSW